MSLVKRHPIITFFVLAYAISWVGWPLYAAGVWPIPFLATGPLIAALIVISLTQGLSGLHPGAPARERHVGYLEEPPPALPHDVVLGRLRGYPLVAGLEGEALAVVDDPEVQVELGPAREGDEDALFPDQLGYWYVLVLVPVSQGLFGREIAPPELGEPEAVRLDVGGQLAVVGDVGELHPDLW